MMAILVIGASGATGKLLVEQLLHRGELVKIIVRSADRVPETIKKHENVSITCANVLELSDNEMILTIDPYGNVKGELKSNLLGYFDFRTRIQLKNATPKEKDQFFHKAVNDIGEGTKEISHSLLKQRMPWVPLP